MVSSFSYLVYQSSTSTIPYVALRAVPVPQTDAFVNHFLAPFGTLRLIVHYLMIWIVHVAQ